MESKNLLRIKFDCTLIYLGLRSEHFVLNSVTKCTSAFLVFLKLTRPTCKTPKQMLSTTSRERAKSAAPYLRLKKSKRTSKCQVFFSTVRKKLKIFRIKKIDFFWSPVSRIVPKNVKGGPLGIFEHRFFLQNRKKLKGGPFGYI